MTAVTFAVFLLAVKALFFYADSGYRDASQGGSITCSTGADCVYRRYLESERGSELAAAGVTDAASFTQFYWNQQFQTAGLMLVLCVAGSLVGAFMYGATRPKPTSAPRTEAAPG